MYALVSYRNSLGITFLYLLRNVKEYLISTMNKKVITRGDSNAVMLLTGINDLPDIVDGFVKIFADD
jgi:hypothetical protein